MIGEAAISPYANIDQALSVWAVRHSLVWLTDYQDTEVRTFYLGEGAQRAQVSVERPHEHGLQIRVGRSLPGKHRSYFAQLECRFDEIDATLDVALQTALIWLKR